MPDNTVLYFAYGSNMLTRRLRARTPSARVHGIGYVSGRRLTFSKTSDDGSGKCDIELTHNGEDRADGVLFSITQCDKPALDEAEGLNRGYDEVIVDVVTPRGVEKGRAYVASRHAIDPARQPYHWYKALVIAGAIEHGLPATHIERLWAVASRRDPRPDRRRKREAEAALEDTGAVLEWYRRIENEDTASIPISGNDRKA
jgi:AIG2 family protein